MKKVFFLLITTMFASCFRNEGDQSLLRNVPINISVERTRANDSNFEVDDKIGLYVVNHDDTTENPLLSSGNHVDNMCFTFNETWIPTEEIYWKNMSTKADFYVYYPYGHPNNVNNYSFSVQTDQSNENNYWQSDFLWGKQERVTPTQDVVTIETKHLFSNALIYVVAGSGFTEEELATSNIDVKICNIKNSANINLATGETMADGNLSEITPWYTNGCYRAMVLPQKISKDFALISITIDGDKYTHYTDISFEPNTQHKFTVTINKLSNRISVNIKEWEQDNIDYGGEATYPLDMSVLNALQGEWIAKATVKEYDYNGNVTESIKNWNVLIGDLTSPNSLEEEHYSKFENFGISKEKTDMYFAELKELEKAYNSSVYQQNRILCQGWSIDDSRLLSTASHWDLFLMSDYSATTVNKLFEDFGAKWYLQVNSKGEIFVPVNIGERGDVLTKWYNGNNHFLVSGNFEENVIDWGTSSDYTDCQSTGIPVVISDNGNTIILKSKIVDGTTLYPNVVYNYSGSLNFYNPYIVSDVVLTKH